MVTTAVVHGVTLRGTTMYHNQVDATIVLVLRTGQNGIAHKTPQACNPKVVATAVNTVITIFKILLQMLFLFSFSIVFRFIMYDYLHHRVHKVPRSLFHLIVIQTTVGRKDLECIAQFIPLKKGV